MLIQENAFYVNLNANGAEFGNVYATDYNSCRRIGKFVDFLQYISSKF